MYIEDNIENKNKSSEEENPSVEEVKAEEDSTEETPVEEAKAEGDSAEETPVEEAKAEGDSAEETLEEEAAEVENLEPELKFYFKNLIGKKIGMTQLFSNEGNVYPATIVEAGPCCVTQIKNIDNDGYDAIQIGFSDMKESKVNKSLKGHFKKSNSNPKKILKEFRISNTSNLPKIGDIVDLHQFDIGELITVTGLSIGKGFAGHMKRHGFSGGRASHGKNSVMRKSGSVGAGTDPGRIFPGMKMAGRMGNNKVTVKNLQVLNIDYENNLIFIKGSLPGSNNNYLFLTKD